MLNQPRPVPRHLRNLAWKVAHEFDQRMGALTRIWPRDLHHRGQELRRLASEAADHVAVGADLRAARPFRRHLMKAVEKLGWVKQVWRHARNSNVIEDDEWAEMEQVRDRAERLSRGLYLALGRQIRQERSTLKGMRS